MENAETLARRAVSLAEKTDWSTDHAAACIALGEVLHKRGLSEQAQAVVRKALDLYEAKGNIVAVEGVRALQARLVLA
jgi:Flp pilus assembly protein TadD